MNLPVLLRTFMLWAASHALVASAQTGEELRATLFPTRVPPGVHHGESVAADGDYVVVGAPLASSVGIQRSGMAVVYNATTGAVVAVLAHPTPAPDDYFGSAVAISGNRVAIGAPGIAFGLIPPAADAGRVYIYDLGSATPTAPAFVLPNPRSGTLFAAGDFFGSSVAMSGTRLVVGTQRTDGANNAYVYDLTGTAPSAPIATLSGFSGSIAVAISANHIVIGAPDRDTAYVYDGNGSNAPLSLPNPTASSGAAFGVSVAVAGNRVVVGASGDDAAAVDAGAAYVYDLGSSTPATPVSTLNSPTPAAGDAFGRSVAAWADSVIIGAAGVRSAGMQTGAAYLFNLQTGAPAVTFPNPSPDGGDSFGSRVALSNAHLLVGAYLDDTSATDAGSAYLYDVAGNAPTVPVARLEPPPSSGDNFGHALAISGNRLVVTARGDSPGARYAGAAYVYDLGGATPTVPSAALPNPSPAEEDFFGLSVAVSGNRVVVGAPEDDTGAINAGSAYVFDLASATPMTPAVTLNNPSPSDYDYFGTRVAISGNRVAIGAYNRYAGASSPGTVYIYDLAGATPSVPILTLNNPDPAPNGFGTSLAMSGDRLVVGAPGVDAGASDAGAVYVYDLASSAPTVPVATVTNPSPGVGDEFGISVALSDNRIVVVGASSDDTGAMNAGSAYIYDLGRPTPPTAPLVTLNNPSPATDDRFGYSVAISGTRVLVGAYGEDANVGAAYVYELGNATPSVPVATLNNPNPASVPIPANGPDLFGFAVATSAGHNIVGAPGDDTRNLETGVAYVFGDVPVGPPAPEIGIDQPLGRALVDGTSTVDFGAVPQGENSVRTFVIRNIGDADLSGITVAIDGANAAEFRVSAGPDQTVIHGGQSTTFTIKFTPVSRGAKGAALHITSNDADENPFDIALTGTGANRAPTAALDHATTAFETPIEIDVLANDTDQDGDSLTLTGVQPASHGFVEVVAQRVRYTPLSRFSGSDSFTYSITDGAGGNANGTVEVIVSKPPAPSKTTLFIKGNAVPGAGTVEGIPAGAVWNNFGVPSINDVGDVAFFAALRSPKGSTRGIYRVAAPNGEVRPISNIGGPVPDEEGAYLNGLMFARFKDPLLNADGDVAFLAKLAVADGTVTSPVVVANDWGIWTNATSGAVRLVAREGDEAPGIPGAKWKKFDSVALGDRMLTGNDLDVPRATIAFVARLREGIAGIGEFNNLGLWIYESAPFGDTSLRLALRQGMNLPLGANGSDGEKTVASFVALTAQPGAPGQGRGVTSVIVAQVKFTDGTEAIVECNPEDANVRVKVKTDDVITDGLAYQSFGLPTTNSRGDLAFPGRLRIDPALGVTTANDDALLFSLNGFWPEVLAREGVMPATPASRFEQFRNVVYSDSGMAAFTASHLRNGSRTHSRPKQGVWWLDAGELKPLALQGQAAPGAGGAKFARFSSLAMPEGQTGPIFIGKLQLPAPGESNPDGVTGFNNTGVWATDSGGNVRLIARTGNAFDSTRTIRQLTVLGFVSGSEAQTRSFNNNGEIILRATLSDNAQAIIKTTVH